MQAEVTRAFNDLETGTVREVGDIIEVSPSRFAAINGTQHGELAKEVKTSKRKKEVDNGLQADPMGL